MPDNTIQGGRRPRRRMRYDQTAAAQLQQENSEPALDDDPGALGLDAEEWSTAAEIMAQEATQAQEEATEDPEADNLGGAENAPPPPDWGDAFTATPAEAPDADDRPGRYRERLTTAEAEADRLRGMVESMQRAEVDRLAGAQLADAADLWRGDNAPAMADLLGDDGRVDPAKVDGAVSAVLVEHPHWRAPMARYRGEMRSGATERPTEPRSSFASAFGPKSE